MVKRLFLVFIALLLVLSGVTLLGCAAPSAPPASELPPAPETIAPSPPAEEAPTYLAKPLANGIVIGDFSVTLSRVERVTGKTRRLGRLISEDDYATLYFTIRRVNATADKGRLLATLDKIRIIDDHGNKYSDDGFRRLRWRDSASGISFSSLPVGFSWVEAYDVVIPIVAPIIKIQLLTTYPEEVKWEIDYPEYQLVSPDLDAELREEIIISLGETIALGEWLRWSIGKIYSVEEIQEWLIPFYVENLDYNPRKLNLAIRFQLSDGTIKPAPHATYSGGYFFNSQETSPYRPVYAIQAGYISEEIAGQSKTWLTYYRFPVDPEETVTKMLIVSGSKLIFNRGWEGELYILKITPEVFEP